MKRAKLALLIVAILWGSSFAFQKELLDTIPPVVFTMYNFLITGILFLFFAFYKGYPLHYRWREGLLLGFLVAGMEITQMIGLSLSTAANTSFISNLGMLFIPYFGWLLYNHRVSGRDSFAMLVAGIGLYLLVGGMTGIVIGDFILLVSAFFMGFYFLMSERFESEKGSYMSVLCAQQFFVVALVCAVYLLISHGSFAVDPNSAHEFGLQILIFTALPYALIQWASKYSDEMVTVMYDGITEPLVGGIVAWGLFLEATSVSRIFGALLMVFAFGASVIYARKHRISEVATVQPKLA